MPMMHREQPAYRFATCNLDLATALPLHAHLYAHDALLAVCRLATYSLDLAPSPPLYANDALSAACRLATYSLDLAIAPVYAPEQPVGWQPTALIWHLAPPLYPDDALLAAFRLATYSLGPRVCP